LRGIGIGARVEILASPKDAFGSETNKYSGRLIMGEMNTAELLVHCLENEGVEYVFGLLGKRTCMS